MDMLHSEHKNAAAIAWLEAWYATLGTQPLGYWEAFEKFLDVHPIDFGCEGGPMSERLVPLFVPQSILDRLALLAARRCESLEITLSQVLEAGLVYVPPSRPELERCAVPDPPRSCSPWGTPTDAEWDAFRERLGYTPRCPTP